MSKQDFEGLGDHHSRQQAEDEEQQQRIATALEECRVSIGGKRGDRIAALLYRATGLADPGAICAAT